MFRGRGNLIITGSLGSSSHFNVAKVEQEEIQVKNWFIRYTNPKVFAFGDYFYVNVVESSFVSATTRWMVGLVSETYKTVWIKEREEPSGLFVRDLIVNNTGRIYYTLYNSETDSYALLRENSDLNFTTSNQKSETIGLNCGTKIEANSQIVVVS